MRPLAVVAESLAMIAGNHDERAIEIAAGTERVEQARELRVGVGDLAVVRRLGPRRELRWRRVWRVRIVEVDPDEEGIGGWGLGIGGIGDWGLGIRGIGDWGCGRGLRLGA